MASAILHIKDGYFFEVPKPLWRQDYKTLEDVPKFLRDAHPHATVGEFKQAMDGKILIPQPFGELKNLHDMKSGFGISKFMLLETAVALALLLIFIGVSRRIHSGAPPRGKLWNMFEAMLVFVRDQIARPAIGEHYADRFVPLLWTLFFFILGCNLLGMIPWMGTPTGAFATTLALAGIVFLTSLGSGIKQFGPVGFWKNMIPPMDLPIFLSPLKILIFAIEVVGMLIRHVVLAIRLLANMVAGHVVLLGILGIIAAAAAATTTQWSIATTVSVLGATAFSVLELFVALLQAYIFTFLSALFIGAAIHHH